MIRADTLSTVEKTTHSSNFIAKRGVGAERSVDASVSILDTPIYFHGSIGSLDFCIQEIYGLVDFEFNSKLYRRVVTI